MPATRTFMYGKLHRVTVTEAHLDYVGSITIDPTLLGAAGIFPHTLVDVVNISNGNRLQTYVIEGEKGSGCICLNGAAAHLFSPGDLAIIMAYEQVPVNDLPGRENVAVLVNEQNQITEVLRYTTPALDDLGKEKNNRLGESYSDRIKK